MTREELKMIVMEYVGGHLSCKTFTEAITDYLEGNLSVLNWVRFQMHLGICLGCRIYLRQMRLTVQAVGKLPEKPIPPDVREELMRRFRTWKNK